MKVKVQVPVMVEGKELWEAVMESGFAQYEWWSRIDDLGVNAHAQVSVFDPAVGEGEWEYDNESQWVTKNVVIDDMILALTEALNSGRVKYFGDGDFDIDSDAGDWIMQKIMFGEVVYG